MASAVVTHEVETQTPPASKPSAAGENRMPRSTLTLMGILVFAAMASALALILLLSAFVIAVRNPDPEKVSAYESGFNPFDDARMKFDVRFYLVSILFIIFDLEVAFLFPWSVSFGLQGDLGFWSMIV